MNMKILLSILLLSSIYSCQCILIKKNNINRHKISENLPLKHGLWIETDSLDNVKVSKYKFGKKHGREISLNLKINSCTIGHYKNGMKDGIFKKYWDDGVLMWKYEYSNDTVKSYKIYRTYSPPF